MASSSRTDSKGQMRMDAAFDHLLPLGFSKKHIFDTIKSLLSEEYGSDDCWYFIEEEGYKVVVDKLLENPNADDDNEEEEEEEASFWSSEKEEEEEEEEEEFKEVAPVAIVNQESKQVKSSDLSKVPEIEEGVPRRKPPCYGYLSETESETESDYTDNDTNHSLT